MSEAKRLFDGRITFFDDEYRKVVLDFAPHVMMRIRRLFKGADSHTKGQYGHSPLVLNLTMDTAKDIEMFLVRYHFDVAPDVREAINAAVDNYNTLQIKLAEVNGAGEWDSSNDALKVGIEPRDIQISFSNLQKRGRPKLLLADPMGMGKTYSSLMVTIEPEARPALIVLKPHLIPQWEERIKTFAPDSTQVSIKGTRPHQLPEVDYVLTAYTRLDGWQDYLLSSEFGIRTLIMDEVHELRKTGTIKRRVCRLLAEAARGVVGLSGTPIVNYGCEIWSVLDAISPGCLGDESTFISEWCDMEGRVRDPLALHSFLTSSGLMVRRENKRLTKPTVDVVRMKTDLASLRDANDIAKTLALSVLDYKVGQSSDAIRQFDFRLRQMTGVAKAKSVAQYVRDIVEQGEKVLVAGWHRAVYELWVEELKDLNPVFFTGSESPEQKRKNVKEFVSGGSDIMIISLRSSEGLDGLQHVCRHVVIGELDWSPKIMEQLIGRLDREGQEREVNAHYLTVEDGSDPHLMEVNGLKLSQSNGIVLGKQGDTTFEASDESKTDRVRAMAKAYLKSLGIETEEKAAQGLLGEVVRALRAIRTVPANEAQMQRELFEAFQPVFGSAIQREVRVGERSRLDFLVERDGERVAIECKVNSGDRAAVYRQVRKYAAEANITSLVLFAPWSGVEKFEVDGIKVEVVNYLDNMLKAI